MKWRFCLVFIMLGFLFAGLQACSTTFDPADAYKGQSEERIFKEGKELLKDKSYQDAIKHFEALDVQYPFGSYTETAQLYLIYAYYMNSDYLSTEAAADRFIHAHPTHPHVDYAYFMRGLANYHQNLGVFEKAFAIDLAERDLTQIKKSYADFNQLVTLYPRSRYTPVAHQYLIYLRNTIAKYDLDVGQYYYKRGAYVASANRANLVVRHFQGSPSVPDALVLMIKSYRKLGLTQNADDALRVLQYNYPNSVYLMRADAE